MSDFKAKMHQNRFGWGSAPDPAGGAYSAPPDPLAGFGALLLREGEVSGREGMGERGREGRGEEGRGAFPLFLFYETTTDVYRCQHLKWCIILYPTEGRVV